MREKLKQHCTVISGFAFKSADLQTEGAVPVVKIGNISNGRNVIIDSDTQYVSSEFLSLDKKYHICKGDILISLTGSHMNQPNSVVGRVCRSYEECVYLLNQRAGKVICHTGTDPDYVYYLLSTKAMKESIVNRAYGAANQVNVSPTDIMNIKWPFHCHEEQKRISSVLSVYDKLIEVNNKRIRVLEQMAENLYKEWFVRFRFPGYEAAEFENGIPKGWEYCIIESLSVVLQRGISPDYDDDGNLTVISQKCIRQSIMDIKEARKQTKVFREEINLQDGDTVICSTGTGTLGRVGQVYGEYPNITFDSHVTLVRAKPGIGKHYLFWTPKEMQPWLTNKGIGSTNQQELYRNTIKNAKALKPDQLLLARFETIIEPIHQDIIKLINCQENLIKQRDLLLPRLMSGKLEV